MRYHRFRIERGAPSQEQYGSIVVGIPIGGGDFDKSSISTTEERTVRRCLSIPDGVPFTMLQHPIDGITKEKQLHFLDLTEHLFGLKKQTAPSPTKCRPRTNEGTKGSKATAAKRAPEERSEAGRKAAMVRRAKSRAPRS